VLKLTYEHLSSPKNFLGSLALAMEGRGTGKGRGRGKGKEEFGPPPKLAPGSAYGANLSKRRLSHALLREILSRASAAALSTVLRTTTLSYGNMPFSGTCPAETPQPIMIKFCTIDYVGDVTRYAKNGCNRLAGGGPTDR
jgi:hypothetical protein